VFNRDSAGWIEGSSRDSLGFCRSRVSEPAYDLWRIGGHRRSDRWRGSGAYPRSITNRRVNRRGRRSGDLRVLFGSVGRFCLGRFGSPTG